MDRNLIRQKKNHHRRSKAVTLAAKLQSSSDFWKEFRTCCGERKPEISGSIDKQGWFDHFKQVFSDVNGRFDRVVNEPGGNATEFP